MPRLQERGSDAPQTEAGAIVTPREAAHLLGISVRSVYRWQDEGRLSTPIVLDLANLPTPRPRGPRRNPRAVRYHQGRHAFDEIRAATIVVFSSGVTS